MNNITIEKTKQGLIDAYTALGIRWRHNLRLQARELNFDKVTIHVPDIAEGWTLLTDDMDAWLTDYIEVNSGVRFGEIVRKRFHGAMFYESQIDPFGEWINNLAHWDGKPRLTTWLSDCFQIETGFEALVEWASAYVPVGAIQRYDIPGDTIQEFPILIGGQGIGKSTAAAWLLPPEYRKQWFTDNLNLADDDKTKIEALLGRVVVECGELAGMRKADLEQLKSFISRDQDIKRLAYARNPVTMPRRVVFLGTTNSTTPLPPNDEHRRFVPLTLLGGDAAFVRKYLDANREQIWAEARYKRRDGLEARLPEHLKPAQVIAATAARRTDESLEDDIDHYLETYRELDGFTLKEIAKESNRLDPRGILDQRQAMAIAAMLSSRGLSKKRERRNGKLESIWR